MIFDFIDDEFLHDDSNTFGTYVGECEPVLDIPFRDLQNEINSINKHIMISFDDSEDSEVFYNFPMDLMLRTNTIDLRNMFINLHQSGYNLEGKSIYCFDEYHNSYVLVTDDIYGEYSLNFIENNTNSEYVYIKIADQKKFIDAPYSSVFHDQVISTASDDAKRSPVASTEKYEISQSLFGGKSPLNQWYDQNTGSTDDTSSSVNNNNTIINSPQPNNSTTSESFATENVAVTTNNNTSTTNNVQIRRRHSERTVGEAIQLVKKWRGMVGTKLNGSGKGMSLREAAVAMDVPLKTLEDYMNTCKKAKNLGYNFEKNFGQKFGSLRKFVKANKEKLGKWNEEDETLSCISLSKKIQKY